MSMFESNAYRWRETYFVLFKSTKRPTLKAVEQVLTSISDNYQLANLNADDAGLFDSLTLISSDDFAALDICYTSGEEVLEHTASLIAEIDPPCCGLSETEAIDKIKQCDGRFDVLHFEYVAETPQEEDADEMLDPSALLLVLGALEKLTDGIAIDPQGGTILPKDD